ncbi:autotransporter outer membrane beta-barrel domain-containing protein [Desulfosarcina sp. OttesenSCG-928-G10]|nr:autotransporter outer membrane beta-barrel domain-containing protein [Desulfosarcina sp. OttesenSCG-928-G10]
MVVVVVVVVGMVIGTSTLFTMLNQPHMSGDLVFPDTTINLDTPNTASGGVYASVEYWTLTDESGPAVSAAHINTNRADMYAGDLALVYQVITHSAADLSRDDATRNALAGNTDWNTDSLAAWFKDDTVFFADNAATQSIVMDEKGVTIATLAVNPTTDANDGFASYYAFTDGAIVPDPISDSAGAMTDAGTNLTDAHALNNTALADTRIEVAGPADAVAPERTELAWNTTTTKDRNTTTENLNQRLEEDFVSVKNGDATMLADDATYKIVAVDTGDVNIPAMALADYDAIVGQGAGGLPHPDTGITLTFSGPIAFDADACITTPFSMIPCSSSGVLASQGAGIFTPDVDVIIPGSGTMIKHNDGSLVINAGSPSGLTPIKATTPNQAAVATGLETISQIDNTGTAVNVYDTVRALDSAVNQPFVFDMLSGEIHASLHGGLMETDRWFGEIQRFRLSGKHAGMFTAGLAPGTDFWGSADRRKNTTDRTSNTGKAELNSWGVALGVEKAVSDWTVGAAFRYSDGEYKVNDRASKADLDSFNLALYAGRPLFDDFNLKLGAGYGLHQVDSKRHVAFMAQALKADYDVHTVQAFTEIGWMKKFEAFSIEPYAGISWNFSRNERFTESGGSAALRAKSEENDNIASNLGIRGQYKPTEKVVIGASVDYQHLFGDRAPESRFAFAGGNTFTIEGAPMDRNSIGAGVDVGLSLKENLSVRGGYLGRFGEDTDSHAGYVNVEISF